MTKCGGLSLIKLYGVHASTREWGRGVAAAAPTHLPARHHCLGLFGTRLCMGMSWGPQAGRRVGMGVKSVQALPVEDAATAHGICVKSSPPPLPFAVRSPTSELTCRQCAWVLGCGGICVVRNVEDSESVRLGDCISFLC